MISVDNMIKALALARAEFPMRITGSLLLSGVALLAIPALAQDGKLDVTVVKYDGLKDVVVKNRGKVVVVDLWRYG